MPDQKPQAVRRTCVCGSDTWHEVKERDDNGAMPVHGTLSCSNCGAAKFASRFVKIKEEEE